MAGLRVLCGIGGKPMFAERYRRRSRALRAEGYRVGAVTSWIEALGTGLPGLFLAVVTWLAARMAAGGTLSIGEMVAVYGYVAVLVVPVSSFIEGGADLGHGLVAARRVVRLLNLEPESYGTGECLPGPTGPAELRDAAPDMVVATVQVILIVDAAHVLPVVAVLLVGGACHIHGVVGLGAVIAAGLYLWQLTDPVDRILMHIEQLQLSGACLARITGVGEAAVGATGAGGIPADDRLVLTGVRYAYREGRDVLHGVDLAVQPGERLAVVGPSGAGKSTLGRLLAGVDAPREGSVTLGGVPVCDLSPDQLRRRVLLVTQEHHVFLGTLRDNLSIASSSADDERLRAALATVDADWAAALPEGLDTRLGPDGVRLDATRAQQLALARVVLADPHTVILDEATASLDPTTARHTERALAAVLAGRTVIAIAHRLHTAHDADRVAVLDDGRLVELGSHDELVAAGGAYAALWRSWHGSARR